MCSGAAVNVLKQEILLSQPPLQQLCSVIQGGHGEGNDEATRGSSACIYVSTRKNRLRAR